MTLPEQIKVCPNKNQTKKKILAAASFTCVVKPVSGSCAVRAARWRGQGSSLARGRSEGHAPVKISTSPESSPHSLQQVPAPRGHFILKSGWQGRCHTCLRCRLASLRHQKSSGSVMKLRRSTAALIQFLVPRVSLRP